MIREIREGELQALLELYWYLHKEQAPLLDPHLEETWRTIFDDPDHHIIVAEHEGRLVSSCVCVIIPNLTRNARPYAFVENVVTHEGHRGKGLATACLDYAAKIAKAANCYKIMLLTGSKSEATLNFYRRAGYNSVDKKAFIRWL